MVAQFVRSEVFPMQDVSPTFFLHLSHIVMLINGDWHTQNWHSVVRGLLSAEQTPVCYEKAKVRVA